MSAFNHAVFGALVALALAASPLSTNPWAAYTAQKNIAQARAASAHRSVDSVSVFKAQRPDRGKKPKPTPTTSPTPTPSPTAMPTPSPTPTATPTSTPTPTSTSPRVPAAAAAAGFTRMTFGDEFTSMSSIDTSGTGAAGYKWFTDRPFGWGRTAASDLTVTDGVLTINPSTTSPNYSIGTSSPTSRGGKGFKYAYFEASMAFDPADALKSAGWPSFWGLSHAQITGAGLARNVELDFFEAYHDPYSAYLDVFAGTVHDLIIGPPLVDRANYGNNSATFKGLNWNEFHTYGTLWEPGKITWYLDGKPLFAQAYSGDAPPVPNPTNLGPGMYSPLDTDESGQSVILGTDIGFPLRVDWVRVWQR